MARFKSTLSELIRDEEGASAVEYALVVGLVAIVIIAAVTALGRGISGKMNTAATTISGS